MGRLNTHQLLRLSMLMMKRLGASGKLNKEGKREGIKRLKKVKSDAVITSNKSELTIFIKKLNYPIFINL